MECFTYLNRALESTISPHVILATNRGQSTVRGTEFEGGLSAGVVAPHGIPLDLLDRCMIVRTLPYVEDEIRQVIRIRTATEGIAVSEDALNKLTELGKRTSLRFALQLLAPASVLTNVMGRSEITVEDIEQTEELFLDARSSARQLADVRSDAAAPSAGENAMDVA